MVAVAWPLACTLCCAVLTYGLSLWVKLQREKDLSARALDAAMRAVQDVETLRKELAELREITYATARALDRVMRVEKDVETLRKELAEVRETTRAVSSAIMEQRF